MGQFDTLQSYYIDKCYSPWAILERLSRKNMPGGIKAKYTINVTNLPMMHVIMGMTS